MRTYGRGRLRASTPDERQPRAYRKGRKQVACEVDLPLYAQVDLACRKADVPIAHAIRQGLRLWLHVQQRR